LPFGAISLGTARSAREIGVMNRLEATRRLRALLTNEPVVASLGHPAYDLFEAGDRPENFYTWGSMGLASSIGLGVAMAQPGRRVVVLDGDGSLLMNLGSLATIATVAPPNLVVIVWDNELYGTTGGQPTATAQGADLAGAAQALGIPEVVTVREAAAFDSSLEQALREPGPWVIVAKVAESGTASKPPLDSPMIKRRFMAAMGRPE
jgi:thiamine pyrophosphate-dependent acetolactate synthase large subunit-like protein